MPSFIFDSGVLYDSEEGIYLELQELLHAFYEDIALVLLAH